VRLHGGRAPAAKAEVRELPQPRQRREAPAEAGGVRRRAGQSQAHLDGRLPDKARFDVEYDAARTCWHGALVVGQTVLHGEAPGVFRLLEALDAQYRAWLAGSLVVPAAAQKKEG
jgi:hypothetical protein